MIVWAGCADALRAVLPDSEGYGKKRPYDDRNDNAGDRDGGNKRPNFGSGDRPSGLKVRGHCVPC